LELTESVVTTSIENEIREQEETSIVDDEKESTIKTETNEDETIKETESNDLSSTIEIQNNSQEILNVVENKIEDNSEVYENRDLELSHEIKTNDLDLINKTNDNLEPINENKNDVLHLTKNNEIDVIEQLNDNINDLVTSKLVVNENINLNISEEIKILDDAVINSLQSDNLTIEKYLQVNGEISPVNCNDTEHNLERKIENHISSDGKGIEIKSIETQNSLNTRLCEDLKVDNSEENNDKIPLIIDPNHTTDRKENINDNVANQERFSNSSDSETIVNSECLQCEINDNNNKENSEKNIVAAQPISVITIQTCDAVDSDCSEAYLTPNELNDTPKKVLEKNNVNANDSISTVNEDIVSQSNPSIESNNDVEIPSKNTSETIIEQKLNEDNIDEVNENVKKTDENTSEIEENLDKVEEHTDTVENVEIIENCKVTEVEIKEDVNIVLRPQEEHNKNIEKGMFYSLKVNM